MSSSAKKFMRVSPSVPWEEYERQVKDVLSAVAVQAFKVDGKRSLTAGGDEYEVDAYAEVEFGGATIKIIIECKRYKRPISRDLVLTLYAKTQELGAHKAMLFSTSGFQRGAVSYAVKHGIALVKLADGRATYMSKGEIEPQVWPETVPKLVALLRFDVGGFATLGSESPSTFRNWLVAASPPEGDNDPADDSHPDADAPLDPAG